LHQTVHEIEVLIHLNGNAFCLVVSRRRIWYILSCG